ncbi:DMT family transporter [Pseudogemmobacter lacusdianii]|nr:DMT family transporter [Xinfangfangia sp. CPCC 101601]
MGDGISKDRAGFAVTVMIGTDLTLSIADAIIKATLASMPLSQFIFLRSCISIPLLILILRWRYPSVPFKPLRPGWASLRSFLLLISLLLYYAALPRLEMSLAAAAYYTIPLFITLFSVALTREPAGRLGWAAVVLGFLGVLTMLRPDPSDLNIHALMPIGAAILYALAMVVTRTKARSENPFLLALIFNLIALVLGGGGSMVALLSGSEEIGIFMGPWLDMQAWHWGLILLLSATMLIGSVGTAIAYQSGPSNMIATVDFSYLVFAVILGVLVFSERLGVPQVVGISLIACAGIIVTRR